MDSEVAKLVLMAALVVIAFMCFRTLVCIAQLIGCVCDWLRLIHEFTTNEALKQISDTRRSNQIRMWISEN